jgi:hypothetical protein
VPFRNAGQPDVVVALRLLDHPRLGVGVIQRPIAGQHRVGDGGEVADDGAGVAQKVLFDFGKLFSD